MFEALLNLMSRALEGLSSIPWGVHAAVALAMAVGLVIWLVGQRMVKSLLVGLAAVIGAGLGGLLVPSTSWGASLSVWHGLGVGAIAGLIVGLLLYRSAMAVGFGVVMGAALPLAAATVLQFYPMSGETGRVAAEHWGEFEQAVGEWERVSVSPSLGSVGAVDLGRVRISPASFMDDPVETASVTEALENAPENLRPAAEAISAAWASATARVREGWEQLPSPHRAIVGFAGVLGLAGGVILGLIMPACAAAGVTSLFGSAIWLPSFVWLSNAMSAPWKQSLDRSPATWLGIWVGAAVLGMIVQWTGVLGSSKKPTGKPAPAAA